MFDEVLCRRTYWWLFFSGSKSEGTGQTRNSDGQLSWLFDYTNSGRHCDILHLFFSHRYFLAIHSYRNLRDKKVGCWRGSASRVGSRSLLLVWKIATRRKGTAWHWRLSKSAISGWIPTRNDHWIDLSWLFRPSSSICLVKVALERQWSGRMVFLKSEIINKIEIYLTFRLFKVIHSCRGSASRGKLNSIR